MADSWFETEIHLWCADLSMRLEAGLLSEEELERAKRLIFERDRNRFIVTRSMLRRICAGYTGENPNAIKFRYGIHGKPELVDAGIHFNLSHSEDLAIYAFSSRLRVGVDIERIRPVGDAESIVRDFFSAADHEAFVKIDPSLRNAAFFRYWTRREALLKAMALGIATPPEDLHVSVPNEYGEWSVRDIAVGDGFAGALAADASEFTIVWRDVSEL
jgi:4'-phosphopantetheinyl transferase